MTKANQTIENVGGVPKLASDALARALTMLFIERAKAMKDVWQKMTEAQQKEWVESTANGCKVHSIAAVNTILSTERTAVAASIKKTTNAKDMQAVLVIDPENGEDALIKLLLAKEGARCMVVFSDTSHYWEGMDSIPLDPDQYSIMDEIEKLTAEDALNWAINIPIMIGETVIAAPSQQDAELYARSIRMHLLQSDDDKTREYAKLVYAMPYQSSDNSHKRDLRKGDWEALINWFAKLKTGDVEVKPFALIEYRPENQHDNVEFDAGQAFVGDFQMPEHDHRIEFKIHSMFGDGEYIASVTGSTAEGQSDSDHVAAAYDLIASLGVDAMWSVVDSSSSEDGREKLFDAVLYCKEDQYSSAEAQELAQALCGIWAINEPKDDTPKHDHVVVFSVRTEPYSDAKPYCACYAGGEYYYGIGISPESALFDLVHDIGVDFAWRYSLLNEETESGEAEYQVKLYFTDQLDADELTKLAERLNGQLGGHLNPDTAQEPEADQQETVDEPQPSEPNLHWVDHESIDGAFLVQVTNKGSKFDASYLGHRKTGTDAIDAINQLMRHANIAKIQEELVYHHDQSKYEDGLVDYYWVYPISSIPSSPIMEVNIRTKATGYSGSYQQYRTHKDTLEEAVVDLVKKSGNTHLKTTIEVTDYKDRKNQVQKIAIW